MNANRLPRCAVLFSGGSNSALAAIRAGEQFDRVELLTMKLRGLSDIENAATHAARLDHFFGAPGKYRPHLFSVDEMLNFLLYERYFKHLFHDGLLVLSHHGLCKLSYHWRALHFCIDEEIPILTDGAVDNARIHPEQTEKIMLRPLRDMYASFGITYENPVYEQGDTVGRQLHDLRYKRASDVKGTKQDDGTACPHQTLWTMFLRHTRPDADFTGWESRMAPFYADKIALMTSLSRELVDTGNGPIASLIKKEESPRVAKSLV